jgi:hypothetical protein
MGERGEEPMTSARMEAALTLSTNTPSRGEALLLHHCLSVAPSERRPARERLEEALGHDLSKLLVGALVPRVQDLRGSSSP